ncbi:hypothetical protein Vadar_011050 [Vaccinium darrowii]|uniref:Uncharacterized protein n=1 Tax=Vaccinium darrowii TaxID=229202 RepID=A0ACB7Z5I6_9ERIC|nr:hypothetical protein Vadar_011050 [Vaccinium darrowii]
MSSSRRQRMDWKGLDWVSLEMEREKAMRSRLEVGVRAVAQQRSRMRCGLVLDLRRERAARDFCLELSGVLESGFRMDDDDDEKFWRWIDLRRSLERKFMIHRQERER